jgi:hypothetical protein
MVQSISNCAAKAKRDGHARSTNTQCHSPIAEKPAEIHLEADQEQEEDQAKVRNVAQGWHGGSREDGIGEAGNPAHNRWTQENSSNDFGNDSRLSKFGEGKMEQATEDDDNASLVSVTRVSLEFIWTRLERFEPG